MATIDQILGPQRERVRASCEAAGIAPGPIAYSSWCDRLTSTTGGRDQR